MKVNRKVINPIVFIGIYMVYFFFIIKYFYSHDMFIGLKSINESNISIKLLDDFLSSSLMVIIIIFITFMKKQSLSRIGITKNNSKLAIILLCIYFGMFFIKGDYSLVGIYKCFFYLIIVSLTEELIFRGYLFTELERELPTYLAIIISGMMWGAMHAFMPIIMNNYSFIQSVNAILSELGGGILGAVIYVYIYKKSKSLTIPIMIHAILDFSSIFL
ncbi:MAG: CPBP family intramembrane glutamic endopeptidase [Bacilli bacterium]